MPRGPGRSSGKMARFGDSRFFARKSTTTPESSVSSKIEEFYYRIKVHISLLFLHRMKISLLKCDGPRSGHKLWQNDSVWRLSIFCSKIDNDSRVLGFFKNRRILLSYKSSHISTISSPNEDISAEM